MSQRLVQAIGNYETMLRLQSAGRLSEQEIQQRVIRYRTAAVEEWAALSSTRPILCNHGIPALQFPMYHSFSRQLGKLKRQGRTMARMQRVESIAARWVARGLNEATLREIAASVFNLPWPAPAGKTGT